VALGAAVALAHAGCAPSLKEVRPVAAPDLGAHRVRTVAVLPVDLAIDADDPRHHDRLSPDATARAEAKARPIIAVTLNDWILRRGYRTLLVTDSGALSGGAGAVSPALLGSLDDWMRGYGDRVARGEARPGEDTLEGGLPELPADATLFLGGYGHLKQDESHRAHVAKQVAIGVGVAVLIAAAICLLVFAIRSGSSGGGALSGLGHAIELGVRGLETATRVGAQVALHSPRLAVHATRFGLETARVAAQVAPREPPPLDDHGPPPCTEQAPCRSPVDVAASPVAVDLALAQPGTDNFLTLDAVLVDNATGRVLWASSAQMPVDPVDPRELRQATEHLLAALPPAH
jgi:hypothetical protein